MNLEKIGTLFKKDTKTKAWWMKLGISLILSNIFFFLLFSDNSEVKRENVNPTGWVEMQLEVQLLTPFHSGKKVLLVHRNGRKKMEAVLQTSASETGRITVLVKEDEAHVLLQHDSWEVLPYLKNLTFAYRAKEKAHEIRY